MFYYDVHIYKRFFDDDCTYLGLCAFSTTRFTSLSQCYKYIDELAFSPDAITIRKLDLNYVHIGKEYAKDMDIILNFE